MRVPRCRFRQRVAKQLANGRKRYPFRDGHRSKAVTQIVQAHIGQGCLAPDLLPVLAQVDRRLAIQAWHDAVFHHPIAANAFHGFVGMLGRAFADPVFADRRGEARERGLCRVAVGGIDRAVYCATKHAVEGFTKSMAIEWGKLGIRVNTICPTFIRTPLTEQTFENPDRVAWIEDKIKLGRVGEVEDIMGPTVFLASDASALITGTHLLVDGGWTAG